MKTNEKSRTSMLKKVLLILLLIISAVLMGATCLSFSIAYSFTIGTMLPGTVGVVIAAYAVLRLKLGRAILPHKVWRIIVTVIVCLGILVFVVVEAIIIFWACADAPEHEADYVIVLGCGIFPDGRLTLTLQNRLDAAIEYLDTHEDALCVVSGGQGPDEPVPEAVAMKDYLVVKGVDAVRIVVEQESTSTKENIAYSDAIMKQAYPDAKKAAVVTSDFHVFRAVMIADNCGVDAFGIGAPTPWYVAINCYMREFVGIVNTVLFQLD